MTSDQLLSASKRRPCPICDETSYCSFREDHSLAFCARVSEGSIKACSNGHYMHVRGDRRWHQQGDIDRLEHRRDEQPSTDWATYAGRDGEGLRGLAERLGVSAEALADLEVGNHDKAWTAPMFDGKRERIGVHIRRYVHGEVRKYCVLGSRLGLFMPTAALSSNELFFPEGLTDTAAMITMGLCAVGRPSSSYGFELIRDLIRGRQVSVVLVGDNDAAGRAGVFTLASKLRLYTKNVKVIYPPESIKDAREWLQRGGDAAAVHAAVEAAHPVELAVEVIG